MSKPPTLDAITQIIPKFDLSARPTTLLLQMNRILSVTERAELIEKYKGVLGDPQASAPIAIPPFSQKLMELFRPAVKAAAKLTGAVMRRQAFDKLTHSDRNRFLAQKGKLVD